MIRYAITRRIECLFFVFAATALSGCSDSTPTAAPNTTSTNNKGESPISERHIEFVLSGETSGFIVPCGCTTKQFGGLPRRGTYLQRLQARSGANVVYVDAGGSIPGSTDYDAIKLRFVWKGMAAMQPAAMNMGESEAALNIDTLSELAKLGVPLLSSNLKTKSGVAPWKDTIVVKSGGASIAIIGLYMSPAKPSDWVTVSDFTQVLRTLVPILSKQHDAVVVLAYGAADEQCAAIIEQFPELTAVFAALKHQPVAPRAGDNRVIFAATAQKGKFLAHVDLSGKGKVWEMKSGEIVELDESIPDLDEQIKNLEEYKAELRRARLAPERTGQAPALLKMLPTGYRYAGTLACLECHASDNDFHKTTKHFSGLETLRRKSFEFDPYCLKCHTTGYGGPGGFVDAETSPKLGGIGCESCHGPAQAHVQNPRVKTMVSARTACITCHDPENSPAFNFDQYWPKIKHGSVKATKWAHAVAAEGSVNDTK